MLYKHCTKQGMSALQRRVIGVKGVEEGERFFPLERY